MAKEIQGRASNRMKRLIGGGGLLITFCLINSSLSEARKTVQAVRVESSPRAAGKGMLPEILRHRHEIRSADPVEADDVEMKGLIAVTGGKGPITAAGGAGGRSPAQSAALRQGLLTLTYFGLWFALNVYYNIVNKKVLNVLPLPYSVATLQLGIGALYVILGWIVGLRTRPRPSESGMRTLWPLAIYHGSGQLFTVLSLASAAVSFTHIVKALEPFFSAVVAAVCFNQIFHLNVYLSLIPVVAGVAIACYTEVSFSWLSFATAMASNLAFALRANYSKLSMLHFKKEGDRSMSAMNVYAVVTVLSFLLLLPVAGVAEGLKFMKVWDKAATSVGPKLLGQNLLLSGLFHYLNNEVMYLALDNVHPVTLAVGNTAKRVFIIVASLLVFHNPITRLGAIGSGVGIGGVLVYSLTKQYYDNRPANLPNTPV